MPKWKLIDKSNLKQIVKKCHTRIDVLRQLGYENSPNGKYYKKLDDLLFEQNIDTSHFIKKNSRKEIDKKLTKKLLNELLSEYGSVKDICKKLGLNHCDYNSLIRNKIKKFGLILDKRKLDGNWSVEEDEIVFKNYEILPKKKILKLLPNRTWNAIKLRARNVLKLERILNEQKQSDLSVLLNDNPITYYWIGFLMADGHFSEKRIRISLSIKDIKQIKRYVKFIKSPNINLIKNKKQCSSSAMDSINVPLIRKKFSISNRKTYEPCDIDKVKDINLFVALVIGFIDGDGNIKNQTNRKDCSINIKLHSSWLENLQIISNRLHLYCKAEHPNIAIINKQGYAKISFTKRILVNYLKYQSIKLNLPILNRKWNLIDLNLSYKKQNFNVLSSLGICL